MKNMKMKLLIILFTFLSTICIGQNYDFTKITINGLEVYKIYNTSQILSALGTPNNTIEPIEFPEYCEYRYIRNNLTDVFGFEDSKFKHFRLNTTYYSLNNFLKVGDNISKLSQMGGEVRNASTNAYKVKYWIPATTSKVYSEVFVRAYYNSSNIIICIDLVVPM